MRYDVAYSPPLRAGYPYTRSVVNSRGPGRIPSLRVYNPVVVPTVLYVPRPNVAFDAYVG
ncbi:hypothetical protein BDV93DRAFT_567335 [Ceratobasidium sp. AG-I]|nr:hypothetical protein BDV93DRAFT_567335 [Ceratobasidium sp. AG-I]